MSTETYSPPASALSAEGLRIAIIVSRFNQEITGSLLAAARDAIGKAGGIVAESDVLQIPGAFELPLAARAVAATGRYDAVVCLGAVVRGDTPHFDYVAGEAARGIADAQVATGIPMSFGVLTTDTVEQATDRAGGRHGNKGADAAMTAIEMVHVLRGLRAGK